jgi:hypothetical protein
MAKELIYLFTAILLLFSCQTDTDKKTIADQKKTIDSLEIELNDYKILHSVAKEIIEKDSILLK